MHDLIASNGKEDDLMKNTRKALQEKNSLPLNSRPPDWKIEDDLLFYKDRCYIPDNLEICQKITELYHDTKPTGHPGQLQAQELIQQHYWWPGLHTFVKNYVNGCAICQQHKIN